MVYKAKKKYTWSDGWKPKADANIVGGVVEQIEAENGSVTKEAFLEKSRPEDSVTHSLFEWNDDKAAELYRLDQSKHIIGALRVVYVSPDNENVSVKAFVNVSELSNKASYMSINKALGSELLRKTYLNRIQNELNAFVLRNQHIEELANILIETGENLKRRKK